MKEIDLKSERLDRGVVFLVVVVIRSYGVLRSSFIGQVGVVLSAGPLDVFPINGLDFAAAGCRQWPPLACDGHRWTLTSHSRKSFVCNCIRVFHRGGSVTIWRLVLSVDCATVGQSGYIRFLLIVVVVGYSVPASKITRKKKNPYENLPLQTIQ